MFPKIEWAETTSSLWNLLPDGHSFGINAWAEFIKHFIKAFLEKFLSNIHSRNGKWHCYWGIPGGRRLGIKLIVILTFKTMTAFPAKILKSLCSETSFQLINDTLKPTASFCLTFFITKINSHWEIILVQSIKGALSHFLPLLSTKIFVPSALKYFSRIHFCQIWIGVCNKLQILK